MANIPIRDIPGAVQTAPSPNALLAMDNGTSMEKTTVQAITDSGAPVASKSEAEAGSDNAKRMTALRVKESIAAEVGQTIASAAQGSKADSAVQPSRTISAGTGLVGGGDLSADRSLALSSTALASLALADTAVQPSRAITAGTGLTGGGSLAADRTISLSTATQASLALADSSVQPTITISAGTGLTGGGTLAANRTIALSSASIASLALADSAVQPSRTISAGTGLTGGGDLSANRTIALSTATQASLAKADSAVQPGDPETVPAGGTTGQVLAKVTDDDYDAEWVTSEAATAVSYGPQSLNAAQQGQARANIGAGILPGFRNKIINGNFDVWQRGVGPFGNNVFNADRWFLVAGAGSVNTVNRGDTTSLPIRGLSAYRLRWGRPTPGSGESLLLQKIEDVRTLEGKRATLTFWASQTAGIPISLTAKQVFGTGGSAEVSFTIAPQFNLPSSSGTWAKYSFSFDVPSVSGKTIGDGSYLEIRFVRPPTGGLPTAELSLARVSLVEGDATAEDDPFSPRHIQQELALCQRYYKRVVVGIGGYANAASALIRGTVYIGQMRVSPTAIEILPGDRSNVSSVISLNRGNLYRLVQISAAGAGPCLLDNYEVELDAEL